MDTPDQHERFMRLFLPHEPELLRTVLIFVPHQADARDIVQETAIALWKHFPDYDPSRPFGGWAGGFARMEVKRFLRRAHRQAYLAEEAAGILMEMEEAAAPPDDERERHLADCRARLQGDHLLLDGVKAPQRLRTGDALAIEAGHAQVLVRIESGDGTSAFRFPSIEPPSNRDLADYRVPTEYPLKRNFP